MKLKMTYEEDLIYSRLKRGRANAQTKAQLREDTTLSERAVRKIIHNLSTVHGIPIGHSSAPYDGGYYIIENHAELAETMGDLTSRMLELAQRQNAIAAAFRKQQQSEKEAA